MIFMGICQLKQKKARSLNGQPLTPPTVPFGTWRINHKHIYRIHDARSGRYQILLCIGYSSSLRLFLCGSCSSDRGFARISTLRLPHPASLRFLVLTHTLPSANSFYCQVYSGLPPPSRCRCRANQRTTPPCGKPQRGGLFVFLRFNNHNQ